MIKGLFSGLIAILDIAPGRVLASLGMGFVSFAAISAAVTSFLSVVSGYWGSIYGATLQLISLAGFPTAIGIVIGAIVARISLSSIPKLGKMT